MAIECVVTHKEGTILIDPSKNLFLLDRNNDGKIDAFSQPKEGELKPSFQETDKDFGDFSELVNLARAKREEVKEKIGDNIFLEGQCYISPCKGCGFSVATVKFAPPFSRNTELDNELFMSWDKYRDFVSVKTPKFDPSHCTYVGAAIEGTPYDNKNKVYIEHNRRPTRYGGPGHNESVCAPFFFGLDNSETQIDAAEFLNYEGGLVYFHIDLFDEDLFV